MDAKEKLDDICRGLHRDLYHLKEALYLTEFIGAEAATLNAATFGALFGALQTILGRSLFLHSARLFDPPKKRYALRSIPAAIVLLRTEADNLAIIGRRGVVNTLVNEGVPNTKIEHLGDAELTIFIADYFARKLSEAHINTTLDALKTVRDKIIAHPEAVDSTLITKPTYADLDRLVGLAQHFLDVVWWGCLNVANDSNSDAPRRSTISLHRLLKQAGIEATLPPKTPAS